MTSELHKHVYLLFCQKHDPNLTQLIVYIAVLTITKHPLQALKLIKITFREMARKQKKEKFYL